MKSRVKYLLRSRLLIVCLTVLWMPGCYLVNQGRGQLDLRFSQVPIREALRRETNPKFRQLFAEIPRIKSFAENRLLLNKSENFTGYYKTSREGVSFVVTASWRDELKPYTWWFPVLGSVPYKGFFNRADAEAQAGELQSDGFDTWIFAAPAYSTLGWFRDPITTPMMRRGQYYLVNTIIHEMTHETLFIPNQVAFNEQLAVFVAEKGTARYFREVQGFDDEQMKTLADRAAKSDRFSEIVRDCLPKFQALYNRHLGHEETMKKRAVLFAGLEAELARRFPKLSAEKRKFNNARLLQYQRYAPDSPVIDEIWDRSGGDWKQFWHRIRVYADDMKDKEDQGRQKIARVVDN